MVTLAVAKPANRDLLQYSVYVFTVAHVKRGLNRYWVTWIAALNKVSRQETKTRRIKIRDKIFWTCFLQDLDLSFESPSFSAVFPFFSPPLAPFSAVFYPLNVLLFHYFPGLSNYLCSFHDSNFCCIHLCWLLERCCKCQNATIAIQWDSILWAITVSLTEPSRSYAPTGDVGPLRFEIGFTKADCVTADIEIKPISPLSFTHLGTIQTREKGRNRMPYKTKKCLRSPGGAADPLRNFVCRCVFFHISWRYWIWMDMIQWDIWHWTSCWCPSQVEQTSNVTGSMTRPTSEWGKTHPRCGRSFQQEITGGNLPAMEVLEQSTAINGGCSTSMSPGVHDSAN